MRMKMMKVLDLVCPKIRGNMIYGDIDPRFMVT